MCMLCVIPPNVIPSEDKLIASALNNPHGFGFAILVPSENRIIVEHTMNPDESISRFLELRKKYMESFAMWHARFATLGDKTVANCHPFKVGNDPLTYLGHNGHLPIIEPKGDTRSDTRIFAEDLLPHIGGVTALDNEQVYNLMEDFTSGSKVCILTLNPDAKQTCYLIHEEKGKIDESGVWWSNDSCDLDYLSWYAKPYSSSYDNRTLGRVNQYMFDEPEELICSVCMYDYSQDLEMMADSDICPMCRCCLWCSTEELACLCYDPEDKKPKSEPVTSRSGWDVW